MLPQNKISNKEARLAYQMGSPEHQTEVPAPAADAPARSVDEIADARREDHDTLANPPSEPAEERDAALQNAERNIRLEGAREQLENDADNVSLLDLRTLATKPEGRDAMRENFASGEIAEGQVIDVNFGDNNSAEWNIGAGDLLPITVQEITVDIKYPDGRTETRTGQRRATPRVGYYDSKGYIPIFTESKVTIDSVVPEDQIQAEQVRAETASFEATLAEVEAEQTELQEFLTEQGFDDLSDLSESNVESVFLEMSGREVWLIRKRIGPKKLIELFKTAGLSGQKVDLGAISEEPELREILDQLPTDMVAKIMQIESSGNQFDVSTTGALGCMQLTKWIYHDINPPVNPFKPREAIQRAAEHLLELHTKYGESGAVRAYNQGEANMDNDAAYEYQRDYEAA